MRLLLRSKRGQLIADAQGNVYGTTLSGGFSNAGGAAGSTPYGNVYIGAKGNILGTTYGEGSHQAGLVFELKPPAADHQ